MKIMKWFGRLTCFLLAIILISHSIVVSAEQSEDLSVSNGCHSIDAANPLLGTDSLKNTESAILYEVNSDTLIFAWNADQKMDPSSLAKLVTAIIAIEQGSLSDVVIADGRAVSAIPWDAMSVGIQAEEELTLLDLLYCMLVGSGNDAAAVIAFYLDGSMEKFASRMNSFVASIGCTGSNFTNSHGLYDSAQYTTARDVARILSYACKNETFSELIGTVKYTVPATNLKDERILTTNNHLISRSTMSVYYDDRVTGGRTGVAQNGTRALAATAEKGSMKLVSVVMGCKNTYSANGAISTFGGFPETTALLDKGMQGLRAAQLFYPGQVLKQYPLANADANLYIGVEGSFMTVLPNGITANDLRYTFHETGIFAAPVEKGAHLGTVDVYYGSVCIASAPLTALNKVEVLETAVIVERDEDPSDGVPAGVILAIIAGVFVVVLLLLRYSKKFRKIVGRKHRRKRRV